MVPWSLLLQVGPRNGTRQSQTPLALWQVARPCLSSPHAMAMVEGRSSRDHNIRRARDSAPADAAMPLPPLLLALPLPAVSSSASPWMQPCALHTSGGAKSWRSKKAHTVRSASPGTSGSSRACPRSKCAIASRLKWYRDTGEQNQPKRHSSKCREVRPTWMLRAGAKAQCAKTAKWWSTCTSSYESSLRSSATAASEHCASNGCTICNSVSASLVVAFCCCCPLFFSRSLCTTRCQNCVKFGLAMSGGGKIGLKGA
mmetsp:Transcript_78340/g.229607  ORF Transcript_78340/g.229607 Transcript_78340/m.229607 type:complete len:257 (+) Transcript_78340:1121-1891(+)